MITLSIILNIYFIPIPFWVLGLTKRYYQYRDNAREAVGMSFLWPILMLIRLWFLMKPKKKPDPSKQPPVI